METTFRGSLDEYLGHNDVDLPNSWSFVSTSESFEISFRTKLANGLLLLTGDNYDGHLVIAIRDAGIELTIKFGLVVHQKTVKPNKVRFDDNQWHSILVFRKIREVISLMLMHYLQSCNSINPNRFHHQHTSVM